MKIAVIGRSEILYDSALMLLDSGHEIACFVTAKEAPEYTRTAKDFRELAETRDIPFAEGPCISDHLAFLESNSADIAVSINYTGVIPDFITDLYPLGILNAHGGDLPRYRGNACQAWAILNGEKKIGLCIHNMIGGELDSGDIIARDFFPIDNNTKITKVWQWMNERTPFLMWGAVEKLEENPNYVLEHQSKEAKDSLRCYSRKPEDGRINWTNSAVFILRLINASNKPYAGAFCQYEGKQIIVWHAELVADNEIFCAVPGQITKIGEEFIEVACGNEKLRLLEIEINGETKSPDMIIKSIRKRLS
jgi:UDP-4-amino-4-deoxy-L-arabinose formyltransferase/UDP-glucuronic acid dehydrogenase (UDP-4-keto-hexauronic acid decarboxylating)